jgi:hypothetical protein
MPHAPARGLALFASGIVAADAVLVHATILGFLAAASSEFPLAVQAASSGAAGLIGSFLLTLRTDRRGPVLAFWACVAALTWVAATAIGDWSEADGIIGGYPLPQWWYTTHSESSGASGLTFFGGQMIAGALAGVGLAVPIWFDRTRALRQRLPHAVVLIAVVALTWTAMFHGRWVACRFGVAAPGAAVDIPLPAA